jgi:hypothetical protein
VDVQRLEREEIIAVAGGLLLAIAVFLTWYTTQNRFARIDGMRGNLSAWETLSVLRFLLLAAAAAPFILAWIVVRGHALSWPRGELTAVVGITAFTLVLLRGVVIKPGEPTSQIGLGVGWWLALLGAAVMLVGAALHRGRQEPGARKPPGTL